MAVRFDNNADLLKRTTGMPATPGTQTVCMWAKRKVDTGGFATLFYTGIPGNLETWLELDATGDVLHYYDLVGAEVDMSGPTMTIDTWYFVAYNRTNTARALYYGTEAGGTLTKVSETTTHTASGSMTNLWIGNDIYTEGFNGELTYVRYWDGASLSDAELDAEWRSTTPVRATSLYGDWRLASAATATTDSSGGSHTLTTGGTLADGGTEPTPPSAAGTGSPNPAIFLPRMPQGLLAR